MEGATIVADISPPGMRQQPFPPVEAPSISVMSYNISLNFSSILAKLPGSRFLTRLRRGVYESPINTPDPVATVVEEWATETLLDVDTPSAVAPIDSLVSSPGPWAFFASGYMLGLLLVTIVLHRMRNIIIPSRIPTRRVRRAFPFSLLSSTPLHRAYMSQRLFFLLLPLDFSHTTTRLALHLPSIYFLSKILLIWCLLILQTCQILPSFSDDQKSAYWGVLGLVERLEIWSNKKEMADICWMTFCSVCGALLVEGIMKALDGLGGNMPFGNVNTSTSPFNLVGYAFLLHAYSFPIAHSHKPADGGPSRPDKHAIITIAIPLLQLTIFHILSVSKRLSRHRLIPTALTSLLSLAHFHGTLFLHFFRSSSTLTPTATNITISLSSLKSTPYLGGSRFTYPLLNYVPNIFETILIGTILLTISLNAFVQLLVIGRVDRIFTGLGVGSGAQDDDDESTPLGFFQRLPYEEDFGILLLRVGTASLEATGLRGWNNEVAPIPLPAKSMNRNHTKGQKYGVVRIGRVGVAGVQYGSSANVSASTLRVESSTNSLNPYDDLVTRRRRRAKSSETQRRGLFNEVRTIELGLNNGSGQSHGITAWWGWIKQTWPFFVALWDVLKGLVFFLWDKVRRSQQGDGTEKTTIQTSAERHLPEDHQNVDDDEDADEARRMDREKEVYSRFLRGEEISDDEHDDDFDPLFEDEDSSRVVEDDDEEEEGEREEGEENDQGEVVRLFSDFLQNGLGTSTTSARDGGGEMVLAHLLHGQAASSGPLTRLGWRGLVEKRGVGGTGDYRSQLRADEDDVDDDDIWNQLSLNGSQGIPADSQPSLGTSACVICTTGQREIICWPCRCLSMCDNCREALAARSSPTKHCCPCCRQIVEGYSRIYIP